MRIVSAQLMAEIDRLSQEEYRIPGLLLMENAGIKAFQFFAESWRLRFPDRPLKELRLTCVAGGGNNGGDSLVFARQAFMAGIEHVGIVIRKRKGNQQMKVHLGIMESLGVPIACWEENEKEAQQFLGDSDILVDGIAGTGLNGRLSGSAAALVEAVNGCSALCTLSLDVPSGVGEDFQSGWPAVRADMTLTMGLPKISLYTPAGRSLSGEIHLIDPGFPPSLLRNPKDSAELIGETELKELKAVCSIAGTSRDVYKGSRGHTAVFAGAMGTTGAAVLAAESAGRAGAGLVTLVADSDIYPVLATKCTSLMVKPPAQAKSELSLSSDGQAMLPATFSRHYTSLVVGPGWGNENREELLDALMRTGVAGVLDADGIRVLGRIVRRRKPGYIADMLRGKWVLTPHPGEFGVLAEACGLSLEKKEVLSNPLPTMRKSAEILNAVVVFKSHVVWIVGPDGKTSVVDGMNPAMGTGGSGDVLAGTIAGLIARGGDPYDAACLGCAVHQKAGQAAADEHGWFLAEDLPEYISSVLG